MKKAGISSEAPHITRSGARILFSVHVVYVHNPLFLVYTKTLPFLPVALWRPSIWPFSISSHTTYIPGLQKIVDSKQSWTRKNAK